ncbi:MAG TPA: hypothetical protein VFD66_08105 [Verrucomicrobiae bacterium]|nr:hypothetical protein [Verrucomicrobiae bacterium]
MKKPSMRRLFILTCFLVAIGWQGFCAANDQAKATGPGYQADWRWVHGAVFVPTSAVNEAQQWDEYDPVINDRELHCASIYGINCVRVYLHYFI